MNCPRCHTPIGPLADPDSIVTCPGCGSRLMTRSAALRSQGGPKPAASAGAGEPPPAPPKAPPVPPPAPVPARDLPPSATLPPTPAMLLGTKPSPAATPGSDTARRGGRKAKAEAAAAEGPTLDEVLRELRALRDTQQLILEAVERLRQAVPPASSPLPLAAAAGLEEDSGPRTLSPIRDSRRRSILLVDDDPQTREAAKAELERADFPARTYDDGNAALAAIAEEKPDVIVLELGLGGDMGGTDLVNMIKATMEWVDIPVVLWTREAVAHQKEARQLYGADEVVPKSAGAAALVARVITLFRRA